MVELPSAVLVDELLARVDDAGLGVRDALFTDGTSRWSYGCDNPGCCPPEGRVIPETTRTLVAAEFAGVGAAMAPSRAALADEIAPDPVRIAAVAAIAGEHQPPAGGTEGLEEWRDSAIDHLTTLTQDADAPVGPRDGAAALQGLTRHPGAGHVPVGHGAARDRSARRRRSPCGSGPLRPCGTGRARCDGVGDRSMERR